MLKKLLITSTTMFCTAIVSFGQLAPIDLYVGSTNKLSKLWDSPGITSYATAKDSTGGPNTPYEGTSQYVFDYLASNWWAGNGGFNLNNYGYGSILDLSNHTHLKIAFRGTGATGDSLRFTLTDSTNTGSGYKSGNDVNVAGHGANWKVSYIPLSSFVGISPKDINLGNIQSLTWYIVPKAATASGTFYIDDIEAVDLSAPTITSFSPSSGAEGTVVTITGTNLLYVDTISFNGIKTTNISNVTSTSIDVVVPTGATSGTLTAFNPANSGTASSSFNVVAGITSPNTLNGLAVGPNPTSGVFHISSVYNAIDKVIVTDNLGNIIANNSSTQVDLSNHPNGMYFVTIISGTKQSVVKLIKQ